jgi:hypothetical protein
MTVIAVAAANDGSPLRTDRSVTGVRNPRRRRAIPQPEGIRRVMEVHGWA